MSGSESESGSTTSSSTRGVVLLVGRRSREGAKRLGGCRVRVGAALAWVGCLKDDAVLEVNGS